MDEWPDFPRAMGSAARGLLDGRHFQVAYATSDMDAARDLFSRQFDIGEFRHLAGDMHGGGYIHVELAWVSGVMFELMHVTGPQADFYMAGLDENGFSMRLHHYGYLLRDQSEWDAMTEEAKRLGRPIVHDNDNVGFMRHCFVPVPELGHNLEYILPEAAGLDFFRNVPVH